MKKIKSICILFVVGVFFCFLPSIGQTKTTNVNCAIVGALQAAISAASPEDTIMVNGTCNEHISIETTQSRITLDGSLGGGVATIHSPETTEEAVSIHGQLVTIKNFTITGGQEGVLLLNGGSATIDNNTISGNQYGVMIYLNSFASIINSIIISNTELGIGVWGNSYALIGVDSPFDTTPKPNNIQHNGNTSDNLGGVQVTRSSSAVIVGNTVSNNTGPGIKVDRGSQADISDNHIGGNSTNGIAVAHNSGVNLGNKTGTTIFDLPNMTGTKNAMRGISCTMGGYVDGRLGTLNGSQGTTLFTNGCISGL